MSFSLDLFEICELCADERQIYRVCGGDLDGEAVVVVKAAEWDKLIASQHSNVLNSESNNLNNLLEENPDQNLSGW